VSNNTMNIQGNLTADPDLRVTNSQKFVCHLRVATDERVQVNNVWESRPQFFTVIAWQGLAENAAASLKKGDRVSIQGRVVNRTYQPEAGDTRYFTEIVADEVAVSLKWAVVTGIEKANGKDKVLVAPNGTVVDPDSGEII
jgi:single-strand DNA-binding protein